MDSFNPDDVAIRSGHFIGGEYVEGGQHGARRMDVARPSDGVVYASVPVADADMVPVRSRKLCRGTCPSPRKASAFTRNSPTSLAAMTGAGVRARPTRAKPGKASSR